MAYYMIHQPATVNPNEVLLNPGFGSTSQSIPSSAYQTTIYGMFRELKRQNNPYPSDEDLGYITLAAKAFEDNVSTTRYTVYTNTHKQQPNHKPRLLLRNPPASTTAQNATAPFQEIETSSIKHMKIHDRPVKCKADPNRNVTKAEQRDMDRHYRTSHKAYAASKGILTEETPCGFEGCKSKFTRKDNLLKHWKKYHGYEQPGN
ncbi:hypothetical protein NW768_003005 [Fusarium equiseti]|uniref:C2H2-type domain-containing protein n=1 Tax=Fusarium equiseti TaxID=61235 RepID=A0ABQ8RKM5_FUSEQ|nr:hypothetical protein NW768_003005 [Fusarium equiseti]